MMNMKNSNKLIAYLFLLLSVVFWGYSFISTKIVLTQLTPASIAFFRQIIASVTLLVWLFSTRSFTRPQRKHFLLIPASAFFGIVLYFLFENTGLQYTTGSNASMIVASVPIFTMITEMLFYKLKLNLKMIVCILLSITGVYLVISVNGKLDFSSSMLRGNMLVMGAMVAWVIYTLLNKRLDDAYSSVLLTAFQSIASIFLFIPFVLHEIKVWKPLSPAPLLNLIYLGVFCSAFAYFFYIYAAKRLGPTISSAFLNLIPVVSVIFGYLVLGEKLMPMQIGGMALVMMSLYLLSRKEKEPEKVTSPAVLP